MKKIAIPLLLCILGISLMGCTNKLDESKFTLDYNVQEEQFILGEQVNIDVEFVNDYKTIRVDVGADGPITYILYIDGKQQEQNIESILKTLKLEKNDTNKKTITVTLEKSGAYKIEMSAKFTYKDTEYNICKKVLEFSVE